MARKIDQKCDRCRREGEKLFLKGERCYTAKCAFTRRSYAPGQHGQHSRNRMSEFGMQLQEKQKARSSYDLLERQFREYFEKAIRQSGVTGDNLLRMLERRLDNVVYRMQLSKSRRTARQVVRHGHITVNGRKVNLPAYQVKEGDVIGVLEAQKKSPYFEEAAKTLQEKLIPQWLEFDKQTLSSKVMALPTAKDVEQELGLQQIVEYYSR
jgi:small subunit ribosomal protein S4